MTLLKVRGLSRSFSGLRAVDNVDFDLPQGQIRALIGPNGAGKTTFVGMLIGRIAPDAGQILFDGQDITGWPAHRRVAAGMGYTFQITSVFGALSVHENVALAARRQPAGAIQRTRQALAQVGLSDRQATLAGDLSYGHQRLLELAMGLAQAPRLLILDEPTQGLADAEIAVFQALLRDMAGKTTVLLIEHNMNIVMQSADFITVMDRGCILAEGSPAEIHANPVVQAVYLGTSHAED